MVCVCGGGGGNLFVLYIFLKLAWFSNFLTTVLLFQFISLNFHIPCSKVHCQLSVICQTKIKHLFSKLQLCRQFHIQYTLFYYNFFTVMWPVFEHRFCKKKKKNYIKAFTQHYNPFKILKRQKYHQYHHLVHLVSAKQSASPCFPQLQVPYFFLTPLLLRIAAVVCVSMKQTNL